MPPRRQEPNDCRHALWQYHEEAWQHKARAAIRFPASPQSQLARLGIARQFQFHEEYQWPSRYVRQPYSCDTYRIASSRRSGRNRARNGQRHRFHSSDEAPVQGFCAMLESPEIIGSPAHHHAFLNQVPITPG